MQSVESVRAAFIEPQEFWSSPLYRQLSRVVAAEPYLVGVAAHARAGQVPTFVFFGAVHALLLDGVDRPLADYYPSLRGDSALPPAGAGPHLLSFVGRYEADAVDIVSTRLVQTNQVRRAVGLRLALAAVAASVGAGPAHLLEIGSSAGLLLRHASYGYRLAGRPFGDATARVQLTTEWRSSEPPPDLDAIPSPASTTGVDLHPLDPSNDAGRRWLQALVWPEDRDKAALLDDALTLAATVPVDVLAGDAVDLCPAWSAQLPEGDARIVFHCATRMHVPTDRRAAFDSAIDHIAADGPLYRIAIEGDGIQVTEPGQPPARLYDVEGHLAWAAPAATETAPERGGGHGRLSW